LSIERIEKNKSYNPYPGLDAMFQMDEDINVDEDMPKAKRKYRLLLHLGILQAPTTPGETRGISGKAILKYWRLKNQQTERKVREKLVNRILKKLDEMKPAIEGAAGLKKNVDSMRQELSVLSLAIQALTTELKASRMERKEGEDWRK